MKRALTEVASQRASVASLLHQIERVARYRSGKHKAALGWTEVEAAMHRMVESFAAYALTDAGFGGMNWDSLYSKVKDARNDIMHTGTEAVLAEAQTKALATVLLDALLGAAQGERGMATLVQVMVEHPVCAHRWQTIADVRRTMLVSDFSVLPLADGAMGGDCRVWQVLTADDLAAFLTTSDSRDEKMGKTVACAAKSGLNLRCFPTADEGISVQQVWDDRIQLPLMVTRELGDVEQGAKQAAKPNLPPTLVGIVTAFDLL